MKRTVISAAVALALAGCEGGNEPTSAPAPRGSEGPGTNWAASSERWYTAEQAAVGTTLYSANCAACHGQNGEGAFAWRQRGDDGKFPAPPLNGTGHAWHHPLRVLHRVISKGSPGGQGNMPAWEGKLSNAEMLAVVAHFQSWWPDPVYTAWKDLDARGRGR